METTTTVLFIDAYDSFSNNIIALLQAELSVRVFKVSIDFEVEDFTSFIKNFSAIVIGPGPGTAEKLEDVGIIEKVWRLPLSTDIPVLGICLGFQSLVYHFGGSIKNLSHPRHGIETTVTSEGSSIFQGLKSFSAVQYHSLSASLGHPESWDRNNMRLYRPTVSVPDIIPLAWEFNDAVTLSPDQSSCPEKPKKILMGVRHRNRPFYGVQFHPESICSSREAQSVLINWWRESIQWPRSGNEFKRKPGLSSQGNGFINMIPYQQRSNVLRLSKACSTNSRQRASEPMTRIWKTVPLGNQSIPTLVSLLKLDDSEKEIVVLDSAKQLINHSTTSIIGCLDDMTTHVTYSVGKGSVTLRRGSVSQEESLSLYGGSFFGFIKSFLQDHQLQVGCSAINPVFNGGFIGYIDYEACLETISVTPAPTLPSRSNIHFVFVERSLVIDHHSQTITVQSIRQGDQDWAATVSGCLQAEPFNSKSQSPDDVALNTRVDDTEPQTPNESPIEKSGIQLDLPEKNKYCEKIAACQKLMLAGESYELCLTDQTRIKTSGKPNSASSWMRYCRLRQTNPAPFAAYFRLGGLTLLSSSPERFLSWSQPSPIQGSTHHGIQRTSSTCQFRPIKGTVRKFVQGEDGKTTFVTFDEAKAVLSTQKERAENLMIVDLIRHDLHGIVDPANVSVPLLMSVEEYESVYQLVTVIQGTLIQTDLSKSQDLRLAHDRPQGLKGGQSNFSDAEQTGLDVLAVSLPPGSMTGAPKRRSCQLLTQIEEQRPRSVYSGVLGYLDVAGGGDFSVVIRSMFKWDDEVDEHNNEETWRIGAGGAITVLSTQEGEWDEMIAKLSSVLGSSPHDL